ncbi:trans-aconitate 2-methyltransferase protein [Candidatus Micropelagos thuwalensis]|uniref:Coenzyme A biosynthesis bifunctional protein CoaBC n=1 Tax=Candidatus Micropelagius thuwalensis TaxID=1397666 RepID=U2WT43_9PROT|nr:bifunctional phosphopantothenoylcysteine decarboxylase/phosphopantothenate--cysteine ligase CoaBC [Candidatus Micropelagos thuwalensis]ERL46713.1 trans-aconitate 2-methyltransferase protein [Candidatus Micropelagos thuwalensis]
MSARLLNKRILLIVGGGIAAYKTPELVRQLVKEGADVQCLLSKSGSEFVTALTLASVSGNKVYQNLFDLTDETEMGHIQLSRNADLVLVAPATADLIAKMAQGFANDLASTTLLATDKPVMIAPAMNVRMWLHDATQRNLETLKNDGITIINPNEGDMACGETGPGRMAEPVEIMEAVAQALMPKGPLKGLKALITAGPTHEPIDPIRYIANRSSGKQGYAIAEAIAVLGAETLLVSGPVNLPDPEGVRVIRVETALEMAAACEEALPSQIAIMTAAVADWRTKESAQEKIKKNTDNTPPSLELTENPDILAGLVAHTLRPDLIVGFAAETEQVMDHARAKFTRKGCDWLMANNVSPDTGVMGGDFNTIHFLTQTSEESWEMLSKQDVALRLADKIADYFLETHKLEKQEAR